MGAETAYPETLAFPETQGFNEAAPRWARKRHRRYLGSCAVLGCFNEAAPRWARKHAYWGVVGAMIDQASMRPRHDGRGNLGISHPAVQLFGMLQ